MICSNAGKLLIGIGSVMIGTVGAYIVLNIKFFNTKRTDEQLKKENESTTCHKKMHDNYHKLL